MSEKLKSLEEKLQILHEKERQIKEEIRQEKAQDLLEVIRLTPPQKLFKLEAEINHEICNVRIDKYNIEKCSLSNNDKGLYLLYYRQDRGFEFHIKSKEQFYDELKEHKLFLSAEEVMNDVSRQMKQYCDYYKCLSDNF